MLLKMQFSCWLFIAALSQFNGTKTDSRGCGYGSTSEQQQPNTTLKVVTSENLLNTTEKALNSA